MYRLILSVGIFVFTFKPTLLLAAPLNQGAQPSGTNGINSYTDVRKAVVRIEVAGTILDLASGEEINGYSGSGFIISPTGIAVTDNHVIAGAAALKVYVPGESKPRNATVLGVSECSDLAVIDIQGSDDLPYLEWYTGPVEPGMKVFAAGYPQADPEYTLTDGVVNKAKADGQTAWASLDYVLQHGAQLLGGNSGGPLVNEAGQVVGVNFMSSRLAQYFAIPSAIAQPIVEKLRTGRDLEAVGLFGEAFVVDEGPDQVSGIMVEAVASGSPADKAGIKRGDILVKMEGQIVGADNTMSMYCDILRSHRSNDALHIELVRFDRNEQLYSGDMLDREG